MRYSAHIMYRSKSYPEELNKSDGEIERKNISRQFAFHMNLIYQNFNRTNQELLAEMKNLQKQYVIEKEKNIDLVLQLQLDKIFTNVLQNRLAQCTCSSRPIPSPPSPPEIEHVAEP